MNKKLLIATDAWHPQVNGVVTVLDKMIQGAEKRGFQVLVVHPWLFWSINVLPKDNIRLFMPINTPKLIKILHDFQPDFIHIETEWPLGFTMQLICQRMHLRFTTSYHTNFYQYAQLRVGAMFYQTVFSYLRWFHNKSEKVLVSTVGMKRDLEKMNIRNIAIRPLWVDIDLFRKNTTLIKKSSRPVFLFFGRLAKEKSPEEFFACDLPGEKWVVWDWPLRAELEEKHGSQARFFGIKKWQDLVDILSQCDVLVFPSRTETFGLTIVEALACGVPVAAHDVRWPQDILENGNDGYLWEDLQKSAIACLNISRDNCRKKALQFSWERSVEAFIDNLVNSSKSLPVARVSK